MPKWKYELMTCNIEYNKPQVRFFNAHRRAQESRLPTHLKRPSIVALHISTFVWCSIYIYSRISLLTICPFYVDALSHFDIHVEVCWCGVCGCSTASAASALQCNFSVYVLFLCYFEYLRLVFCVCIMLAYRVSY